MLDNSPPSLTEDLSLLAHAARSAGAIAMGYFGNNPKTWMKFGESPVSEADLAVDHFLKNLLLGERPDYGWVSEESLDDRPARSFQRYFVVDPIDGTRGFLSGKRRWCISLAIVENGKPIAGVLECPALEEFYEAATNCGAKLNGETLIKTPRERQGLLQVSAPAVISNNLPKPFSQQIELVSSAPSLAYRLAMLAKAKLDLVLIRPNCHDWDIAAAHVIVIESGGLLVNNKGMSVDYGHAPFTHQFLMALRKPQLDLMLDIVTNAKLS